MNLSLIRLPIYAALLILALFLIALPVFSASTANAQVKKLGDRTEATPEEGTPASAEPAEPKNANDALSPEQLYAKALEAFEARKWNEAADLFKLALGKDPNAVLAYNAGRAFEYSGDLVEAEKYYLEALGLQPDADLRKRLFLTIERVTNLREKNGTKKDDYGVLEVITQPEGATVQVNGVPIGTTPYQAAHPIGEYTVIATIEGHSQLEQNVQIKPGRDVVLNAELVPNTRIFTWISAGATAALLGGGIWFGLTAADQLEELESVQGLRKDKEAFNRLRDDGESSATASLIFYSLAGVGVFSTIVLWFVESPDTPETTNTPGAPADFERAFDLRLILGPGFAGVGGAF